MRIVEKYCSERYLRLYYFTFWFPIWKGKFGLMILKIRFKVKVFLQGDLLKKNCFWFQLIFCFPNCNRLKKSHYFAYLINLVAPIITKLCSNSAHLNKTTLYIIVNIVRISLYLVALWAMCCVEAYRLEVYLRVIYHFSGLNSIKTIQSPSWACHLRSTELIRWRDRTRLQGRPSPSPIIQKKMPFDLWGKPSQLHQDTLLLITH